MQSFRPFLFFSHIQQCLHGRKHTWQCWGPFGDKNCILEAWICYWITSLTLPSWCFFTGLLWCFFFKFCPEDEDGLPFWWSAIIWEALNPSFVKVNYSLGNHVIALLPPSKCSRSSALSCHFCPPLLSPPPFFHFMGISVLFSKTKDLSSFGTIDSLVSL